MKVIKLATVAALIIPAGFTLAQSGDMKGMDMKDMDMKKCMDMKGMKGMDMKGMDMSKCKDMKDMKMDKKAQAATHKATGMVKNVDPVKGAVTLAHDPVKDLKWPAMTMTFMVKDKKLFDNLAVDKKVAIEFVKQGSDYVVTTVK